MSNRQPGERDSWPIDWIDRSAAEIDLHFRKALGDAEGLLQTTDDLGFKAANAGKPLRILDVGCGTGNAIRRLGLYARRRPDAVVQVVGLNAEDFSQQSRSEATRRDIASRKIAYVLGNASALPFVDGSFDLVYEHEMLFRAEEGKAADQLQEMARVLAPGGRLYFGSVDTQDELGPVVHGLKKRGYTIRANEVVGRSAMSGMKGALVSRVFCRIDKPD